MAVGGHDEIHANDGVGTGGNEDFAWYLLKFWSGNGIQLVFSSDAGGLLDAVPGIPERTVGNEHQKPGSVYY